MLNCIIFVILYFIFAVIHLGFLLHIKNIYSMKELNSYSKITFEDYGIEDKFTIIFDSVFWFVCWFRYFNNMLCKIIFYFYKFVCWFRYFNNMLCKIIFYFYKFVCFCINVIVSLVIQISNYIRLYLITNKE